MHNCEEFRERIIEYIIDREDVATHAEFQRELLLCSSCSEFYVQSREMMEALDGVALDISESQWNQIESRLLQRIGAERAVAVVDDRRTEIRRTRSRRELPLLQWRQLLPAAALLLITIGLGSLQSPIRSMQQAESQPEQPAYVERSVSLDPVTVDFLQESELLLRNVMKMSPNDVEDLADAKKVAGEQLAELEQRKEAAAEVPPVVGLIETYQTVL